MKLRQDEIDTWADAAAVEKGCEGADADRARAAVRTSLSTIYKAVALDIDGTLTLPENSRLDPALCMLVARLLRRGCHVWLITGRGNSGAMAVADDIMTHTDLEPDEWLRLRCITHNGALLRQTDPTVPKALFAASEPLLASFEDKEDTDFAKLRTRVEEALARAGSVPLSLTNEPGHPSEPLGMRALFNTEAGRDTAAAVLKPLVEGFPSLALRTGVYGTVYTIDLTTADKADGLAELARRYHIDPDKVLRVGDQGHHDGNDESLLAGPSGFSVDTTSNSPIGCFPVIGRDGEVLTGAAATNHLLEAVGIAAPLRMQVDPASWRTEFLPRLRAFERAAVARSAAETQMIERQLSVRVAQLIAHDPGNGDLHITVGTLFDRRSGGVRIHEWDLPDLTGLPAVTTLFQLDKLDRATREDDGPTRSMYTDTSVLLRGPDYYPNLTGLEGPEHVARYLEAGAAFTSDAIAALEELRGKTPDLVLVRIALAVMDNIRNIVLQVLNIALFNAQPPTSTDDPITSTDHHLVSTIAVIAQAHTAAYVNLLLEPHTPWLLALNDCEQPLAKLADWLARYADTLVDRTTTRAAQAGWEEGKKGETLRWRETDDIIQNISAVVMGLRAIAKRPASETSDPILAIGLQYGGLELPLLAAALGQRFGLTLRPAAMRVSMYDHDTHGDAARANLDEWVAGRADEEFPVLPLYFPHAGDHCTDECCTAPAHTRPEAQHTDVVIFDDNCTTSTTMQAARDLLIRRGCDVLGVVIVRFPGANRAAHMAMPHHGHLDLSLAHGFVHGLVGPSPYSRLVVESPHKKGYVDENGVFDKSKMRIRLLLHKNSPNRYQMPESEPWGEITS